MKTKTRPKKYPDLLVLITAVYTLGVAAIIAAHLIASGTYLLDVSVSISRYVGMKVWSAAAYIALCAFICGCMFIFIRSIKPPPLYRVFGYIAAAALFSVALFPHTAFGDAVTDVHQVLSRAVFVSMMLHTLSGVFCISKSKRFIVPNLIVLAIDLVLLAVAVCSWKTFSSYIIICEFILIYAYIFSLFTVRKELRDKE